jgi:hypothetical protein
MEEIRYTCPACHADNTQRVSLAYLKGTGTSLSRLLSPPHPKSWGLALCFSLTFLGLAFKLFDDILDGVADDVAEVWIFDGALVILGSWLLIVLVGRLHFNRNAYPVLAASWNAEFICMRCSKRFFTAKIQVIQSVLLPLDTTPMEQINQMKSATAKHPPFNLHG